MHPVYTMHSTCQAFSKLFDRVGQILCPDGARK